MRMRSQGVRVKLAAAFSVAKCSGAGVMTGNTGIFAGYQRTCPDHACGVGFCATLNSYHVWGIEMRDGSFVKNQFFV
jgi:hypothetical protein